MQITPTIGGVTAPRPTRPGRFDHDLNALRQLTDGTPIHFSR